MPLSPGTTLGSYTVTAKIGEGGMGEVYQARDTKLDRDVALKVLPEAFTSDPDRLARFEREAKVLASLNHPNIGSIYGLEEAEGGKFRALVLELIEGPTLADRISQGPIPIDEALSIAKQIAEALEAAHEQGVIHRDLKPANIKVKDDGTVKVLDFGLAKALAGEGQGPVLSQSPTMTATVGGTREGVILGTAAYMSPEQARGKPLDKRTDIWSFGCVLYEILTGRRAFGGDTLSDTIANVLDRQPPWEALPAGTPPAVRKLLRRCLDKDPRERLRDIGDARVELREAVSSPVGEPVGVSPAQVPPAAWQRALPWVAGGAVGGMVAGFAGWHLRPVPAALARDVLAVTLPVGVSQPTTEGHALALSPNGRDLVYVGERDGTIQLYHRPLDQVDTVPIADTAGARSPFFSYDGAWLGFRVGTTLKKVRLEGGAPLTICTLPPYSGGFRWSADDTIWFGSGTGGLHQVAAGGGTPQQVTTPDPVNTGVMGHARPQLLPQGRGILYEAFRGQVVSPSVAVYLPETREHRTLVTRGVRPWFASSGHVVFARRSLLAADTGRTTLWAFPFDVDQSTQPRGPVLVREGVRANPDGYPQAALGMDGTLVYVPAGGRTDQRPLVWVDPDGHEEPIDYAARAYRRPRLSPDGRRVAVEVAEGDVSDIWVLDLVRGTEQPITFDPAPDYGPVWTPDGRRIVFTSDRGGQSELFWTTADGTGQVELLHSEPARGLFPSSWSPDGATVMLTELDISGSTIWDIVAFTMDGRRRTP